MCFLDYFSNKNNVGVSKQYLWFVAFRKENHFKGFSFKSVFLHKFLIIIDGNHLTNTQAIISDLGQQVVFWPISQPAKPWNCHRSMSVRMRTRIEEAPLRSALGFPRKMCFPHFHGNHRSGKTTTTNSSKLSWPGGTLNGDLEEGCQANSAKPAYLQKLTIN